MSKAVCRQTIVNPESKRCIYVGGRAYKDLVKRGKITDAKARKEVVKETVAAQKSPAKVAKSPKRKSPKRKSPLKAASPRKSPVKRKSPKKAKSPKRKSPLKANKKTAAKK